MASLDQIKEITKIIEVSIDNLITYDSDIFNIDINIPGDISGESVKLNRKLHEVTLNHRLAVYLEKNILGTNYSEHKVDIEYNRYYDEAKMLEINKEKCIVRPDILIHTRMDTDIHPSNALVVEAKKGKVSEFDIAKVCNFIENENYNYLFGMTISYCESEEFVSANLYYYNGTEITMNPIKREKLL